MSERHKTDVYIQNHSDGVVDTVWMYQTHPLQHEYGGLGPKTIIC